MMNVGEDVGLGLHDTGHGSCPKVAFLFKSWHEWPLLPT